MRNFLLILFLVIFSACNKSKEISDSFGGTDPVGGGTPPTTSLATTLTIASGNLQSNATGATFNDPLRVQLLAAGSPLTNQTINYTVVSGPAATFSSSAVTTDASGIAQVYVTAGTTSGTIVVRASYLSYTADFTLVVANQTNSTLHLISGDSQTVAIGSALPLPLVVEARDAGTAVPLSNILVRFTIGSGNGRINSTSNTITVATDSVGRASVNFDAGTLAGVNTVTAAIVSLPAQAVTFSSNGTVPTNSTISLSQSRVTSATNTLTADGSQTTTLTLTIKDVYGNIIPVTGETIAFTVNTGTLLGSVSDLGNGTYTQLLRAPANTTPAQISVGGTINASTLTSSSAVIGLLAGTVSLTQSAITSGSNSITADGSATTLVTVTLKDSLGNQLNTGGQTVVLSSTMGTLIGSVTDVGNGTYTQTLKAGTASGSAVISATVAGAPLSTTKTVSFLAGAPDATNSLIIASPATLPPDGSSSSVVTVQLRDSNNNPCTTATGRVVTLTKSNGTWLSSSSATITATDNGDGTYFGILTSSVNPGNSTITATDNTTPLTRTATVYFSNGNTGPSIATSLVATAGSTIQPANAIATVVVTVTLKDSYGLNLGTGGSTVIISSTAGTLLGSVTDNGNGTYSQTLRAPASAAIATISASADSNTLADTASVSFYGPISLSQSTITASPSSIVANGISTTVLFLNAKDVNGVSIPVGGEAGIAFNSTFGTLLGSLVDNSNGTYTQQLQSTAGANVAVVTATQSSNPFSSTASVEFYAATNRAGLTIDCANIATYKNTTLYVSSGTLTLNTRGPAGYCPNDFVFNGIVLQNSAIVTHGATTNTQEYGLELSAGYITIDATSKFDVTGKGYQSSNNTCIRTQGNQDVCLAGNIYVGGSYGGQGASVSGGGVGVNQTYGSIFEPIDLGSSGRFHTGYTSANGGGRIKLTVTGPAGIENAGSIKADGSIVPNVNAQNTGASGGSIWINTTKLSANGVITADGSGLDASSGVHYAGGGGRVAIYYSSTSDLSGNFSYPANIMANVTAKGGPTYSNTVAGAGTVYFKSAAQTYGDLVIDNKGGLTNNTSTNGTVINSPTIAANETVSANSLTKTAVFADSYSTISPFKGWYLDPNISQNSTSKKGDNLLYKITSATANTVITSGGDMTVVASSGNQGELVLVFDNFELGNKSKVTTGNLRIVSLGGDLRSNDAFTASMTDVLPPRGVEYVGAQTVNIDLTARIMPAFLNEDFAGTDLLVSNGTFNFGTLNSKNFVSTGMTLSGTKLRTTGNINFTSTIATFTQPVGNYAIHADGAIDIAALSTVYQAANTPSTVYSLEILGASLALSSNSSLNAVGKGYQVVTGGNIFRVFGNQDVSVAFNGSTNAASGGSHAGRGGGFDANGYFAADVWGSFKYPNTSGGTGGWNAGSAGGGIIRLLTTNNGALVLNGSVDVRGLTSGGYGGAGGSIFISGGLLSGTGSLDASGGSTTGNACGGGGRIAVYYNALAGNFTYPTNALLNIRAYGGNYIPNNVKNGAPGTVFMKSSTENYGKLIINNNSQNLTDSNGKRTVFTLPTLSASTGLSYDAITNRTTLTLANAFVEKYGASNAFVGMYLNPNTAQNATQVVQDDTMFEIVAQTASSLTLAGNATTVGAIGNTFQLNLILDEVKIVGNSNLEINNGVILTNALDITNGQVTGTGSIETTSNSSLSLNANAGTIRINSVAANSLALQNGTFVFPNNSNITTSGNLTLSSATISSTGHIVNVGGDLSMSSSNINVASITSAGFLSLTASTATVSGAISVTDDLTMTSSTSTVGNNITVGADLLIDISSSLTQSNGYILGVSGNVSVSNTSSLTANTINVGAALLLDSVSTLTTGNRVLTPFTTYNTISNLNVNGDVTIINGSTLTSPATTGTEEYYLYVTAPNLTLGASSNINVDGKGYRNVTGSRFRSLGNIDTLGYNGTTPQPGGMAASGSYGGVGGAYPSHFSTKTYGSYRNPIYLGTSSACWGSTGCLEHGGGSIRLNISGTALINGTISAYGLKAQGGGSGGSIYIQTNIFSGSGIIRANGTQSGVVGYGSGGGGRVAIFYTSSAGGFANNATRIANIQAWGGDTGSVGYNGAAGTVYLKQSSQTYGDLIINNNGKDATAVTEVPIPTTFTSSALTNTSMTTASAFGNIHNANYFFNGFYVNPYVGQNATNKLTDDVVYRIISNTVATATTASGINTTAVPGDTFILHAVFDNLEIIGKGKLSFPTQNIQVLEGDLSSNNTTSFVQDGGITAKVVDLGNGVTWGTTANASGTVTTKCSSNFVCP